MIYVLQPLAYIQGMIFIMEPTPEMFRSLKDTFQSMTDVQTTVQALQEAEVFR
jgi:hypothetical protein